MTFPIERLPGYLVVVERFYTVVVKVFYASGCLCSGIYAGTYFPGDAAAGILVGIACSGLVYTVFA